MLAKKLQIKPAQRICVLNAPEGFEIDRDDIDFFYELPSEADFVLIFALRHADLEASWAKILKTLAKGGALWAAYPKKSSGIGSDLARMAEWPVYSGSEWQPVRMISIDERWSAVKFRYAPGLKEERAARADEQVIDADGRVCIDKKARVVRPSSDLQYLFDKNPLAAQFFDSLSFANKKEYLLSIIEAKRPETRSQRLAAAISKLIAGKRNPSEK